MVAAYRSTSIKTGSLLLDSKNARIPVERRSSEQRTLLQALLELEDVLSLAKSISQLGIFPNERLVTMREEKKFIVLEGNRRLAAVKLLINPELAPTAAKVSTFRRLSEKSDLSTLTKLDVVIVEDRFAAAPIVAALHSGQAKRSWSNLQQARFYREMIMEGRTAQEVADDLAVSLSTVQSYLRSELLHRVAMSFELDPNLRRKIEDPRFPLTTLERFIESREGRRGLGLDFNQEGELKGIVHPDRFRTVLTRVVTDIVKQPGLTRKVNRETDMRAYFEEIEPDLDNTKKRGSFNPRMLAGEKSEPDDSSQPAPKRRKNTPRQSSSVVPLNFQCTSKNDRVRAVFVELKNMKIAQTRNSTGIMLRVLIDIALWDYINHRKLAQAVCDHFDNNNKRRNHASVWTPPLRDLISYMCDKHEFAGMDASGYKSVRFLVGRTGTDILTLDGFNAFTHNPHVTPTVDELRELWARAQPMLDIILD